MPELHATPARLPWVRFSYADIDLAENGAQALPVYGVVLCGRADSGADSDEGFGLAPSMHPHFPLIERRRAWADFSCRGVCLIPECESFSSEAQG
jgi:hypothetical protein